jgi:hypothetical protein
MRTNTSLLAVCAYKLPAIKKFGSAIPYANFCHKGGKDENEGDATVAPMNTYVMLAIQNLGQLTVVI